MTTLVSSSKSQGVLRNKFVFVDKKICKTRYSSNAIIIHNSKSGKPTLGLPSYFKYVSPFKKFKSHKTVSPTYSCTLCIALNIKIIRRNIYAFFLLIVILDILQNYCMLTFKNSTRHLKGLRHDLCSKCSILVFQL